MVLNSKSQQWINAKEATPLCASRAGTSPNGLLHIFLGYSTEAMFGANGSLPSFPIGNAAMFSSVKVEAAYPRTVSSLRLGPNFRNLIGDHLDLVDLV